MRLLDFAKCSGIRPPPACHVKSGVYERAIERSFSGHTAFFPLLRLLLWSVESALIERLKSAMYESQLRNILNSLSHLAAQGEIPGANEENKKVVK